MGTVKTKQAKRSGELDVAKPGSVIMIFTWFRI